MGTGTPEMINSYIDVQFSTKFRMKKEQKNSMIQKQFHIKTQRSKALFYDGKNVQF